MKELVILGAGPSLKDALGALPSGDIAVTNHSHDFVVEHGIVPLHAILTETRHRKIIKPVKGCSYMIRNDAVTWPENCFANPYPAAWAISGFPILSVARYLAYDRIHLIAFDSSHEEDGWTHCDGIGSYYGESEPELCYVGDRKFITCKRWMDQVRTILGLNPMYDVVVHGDGLLGHAYRARPATVLHYSGGWVIVPEESL